MTDVYAPGSPFEDSRICPLDQWENEGGPAIDRDIADEYGLDLDATRTDTLMGERHEGLALSVGYAMMGEEDDD